MEYHKEDGWLFGPENTSNKVEGWSMVCWLVCLILLSLILGCDGQAAEATQESVVTAMEKKAELMGHPLYWTATVTQCDVKYGCKTRYYVPREK